MSINYVYTNPTSDYDLMRKYDRIWRRKSTYCYWKW
jgi:hypothetical protein